MCGVAGIIDLSPQRLLRDYLEIMTARAAHRGPDDEGMAFFGPDGTVWSAGTKAKRGMCIAGLGHRRLSIIDLSPSGHQPMSDSTGRYWMVYNGEVYNYIELKDELQKSGRIFHGSSDSEVILQAFIEWGPECLERFNGMWAFAVYDRKTGRIFCARDRYGIKPFYYVCSPDRFAFASEIKQLLVLPWLKAEANRERLADFFLWSLENHTCETVFRGILSLPGSHYFDLNQDDIRRGRCEPRCYWTPGQGETLSQSDAITAFRDLLSDSVRLRLRSDVPVGATLSGGLDSSSVVCLAGERRRKQTGGIQSSFSAFNVEFDGAGYSERRFADLAAKKADAQIVVLRPGHSDLTRDWTKFVWHMEEPFGGLSYFSNFQIYRLIRAHGIPVVLSGQGGDELLLGYERYRTCDALFKLRAIKPWAALREMLSARRHANMPLATQLAFGFYFSAPWLRAMRRRRLVGPFLNRDFFREYEGNTGHLFATMQHRNRRELQDSELFHYQLPHLLRHEDRVSMAHSVETRLPFLDYRLLELVLVQPMSLLFCDGWSKYLLRQSMKGVLPDEVCNRTDKMGYETPTGSLIRQNRLLFLPLLGRHRKDEILDVPAIERSFEDQSLNERLLCSAVSYLSWKEAFAVS